MSLTLHCGASEVHYHTLKDIPITDKVHSWVGNGGVVRTLARTDRWKGIQHHDFASNVIQTCEKLGMPIDMARTRWGVSKEGADLFGYMKFQKEVNGRPTVLSRYFSNDVEPGMGLRHSNRGRFAAQGTIGGSVFVCDNLIITGSFLFSKRHTFKNVENLKDIIACGMMQYLEGIHNLTKLVDRMKYRFMDDRAIADVYLRVGRSKLMPWTHISDVDKLWIEPTHDTFAERYDAWRLYNAFNSVAKRYNPSRQMDVVKQIASYILPEEVQEETICF